MTFEQGTGGREGASQTSDSPSPLHGLTGQPGRVGRQVGLLNSKEG